MAGIYIHIPFCKTRCIYCDFYTGVNESRIGDFVDALCREAALRKDEMGREPVKTIYFGGGTPSRLPRDYFEQLFDTLFSHYPVSHGAEITLEANPDDLSESYIRMLKNLPLNRISIGIQSFNDNELRFLSRRHSSQQAIQAVEKCRETGIENISIDLMYGLPGQTEEIWRQNIEQATKLNIPHISAYHLIYEERTKLFSMKKEGKVSPVHEDLSNSMFEMLIDAMAREGYSHYEISNFARDGFISLHNSSYWRGDDYIGLGPSAHSFTHGVRSWNAASLKKYLEALETGSLSYREHETLTEAQKYNELILTGLRTKWGVNLPQLRKLFGEEMHQYALQNARKFIDSELLILDGDNLKLSRKGIFISDGIMSEMMRV